LRRPDRLQCLPLAADPDRRRGRRTWLALGARHRSRLHRAPPGRLAQRPGRRLDPRPGRRLRRARDPDHVPAPGRLRRVTAPGDPAGDAGQAGRPDDAEPRRGGLGRRTRANKTVGPNVVIPCAPAPGADGTMGGEISMRKRVKLLVGLTTLVLGTVGVATAMGAASADPGVSAKQITIGGTFPLTGPAALYGTIPVAEKAYFTYANSKGGVNGRKINFIFYDDAYDPSQTVPLTQKLVEQNHVFAIYGALGTAP